MLKKILLITTGGTLASKETGHGLSPKTSDEELLSYIPDSQTLCRLSVRPVLNIDSTNMQPEYIDRIANVILCNIASYDGFVIIHGTDTMSYSAAGLSYLLQDIHKPVIITGSQQPISAPKTDAKRNLMDSLLAATSDCFHGVYLVFCGKVITGTRARKIRSHSYEAFDSINAPLAATITDSKIMIHESASSVTKCNDIPLKPQSLNPKVCLLKLTPGLSPDILDFMAQHYSCIVIESYGVGGLPFDRKRNFYEKLDMLENLGIFTVIATQVAYEGTEASVYEVGQKALSYAHVLQTYDMTPEAAIMKMMWILSQSSEVDMVKRLFYTPIHGDLSLPSISN